LSLAINSNIEPEQVKRREYYGIAALLFGLLNLTGGIVGLILLVPLGLTLLCLGAAAIATGVFVLSNIPCMVALPD
jgi:hypothetical protein